MAGRLPYTAGEFPRNGCVARDLETWMENLEAWMENERVESERVWWTENKRVWIQ